MDEGDYTFSGDAAKAPGRSCVGRQEQAKEKKL
jgi:hypothetical protein